MNLPILSVNIEASKGNGEDRHCIYNAESIVLGVFDGLGGRSAGFDKMTGGQIASSEASRLTEQFLRQWNGRLTQDNVIQLQSSICKFLKSQAESKMAKSRLSGTLTGKRLCTTIALASIPKPINSRNSLFEVCLAWMGDSRIYFLSPQNGLQQLTIDDLEVDKDAFQMIREDPPMSQYLTADIPADWKIHFSLEIIEEIGCIFVCTDGCFQYLATPWDFEKLLLETLVISETYAEWENLLAQKYEQIKQDDISLIAYPVGFSNFEDFKQSYRYRYQYLLNTYNTETNDSRNLNELWPTYRSSYEARLQAKVPRELNKVGTEAEIEHKESIRNPIQGETKVSEIESNGNIKKQETSPLNQTDESAILAGSFADGSSSRQETTPIKDFCEKALEYQKASQLDEAIKCYQKILEIEPHNPEAHFELGRIYFDLGSKQDRNKFSWVISHLLNVINKKNRNYKISLKLLAVSYYYICKNVESIKFFEQLDNIDGTFEDDDLVIYANSLYRANRLDEAVRLCNRIHQRNPKNPQAFHLIGSIKYLQGDLREAASALRSSVTFYNDLCKTHQTKYLHQKVHEVSRKYDEVYQKLKQMSGRRS